MMDIISELVKSNPAKLELFEAIKVLECEKELNTELANRLHCYPGNQGKRTRSEIINIAINTVLEYLTWQTGEPKEKGYYLVTNGENKPDIRKWDNGWYHDMYRRYSDEELKVIAWKKIEPYERKESQDGQGTTNED